MLKAMGLYTEPAKITTSGPFAARAAIEPPPGQHRWFLCGSLKRYYMCYLGQAASSVGCGVRQWHFTAGHRVR